MQVLTSGLMMLKMSWRRILVILTVINATNTINNPVYKILLTQKGFTQFIQYDVEIPPIREFTFCTWIRVNEFEHDQSILTYIVNGYNRIIRLWLDSGGGHMNVTINDRISTSSPVVITRGAWHHVCLSYQSDYGAWALYIDSRLISCEARQSISGYVIPGRGSIIIGYGTTGDINGSPNGLEGEVFGASMILASTIERNYTVKSNLFYEQKSFERNKMKNLNNLEKYVVLKDLKTEEEKNNKLENLEIPFRNVNSSRIKGNSDYDLNVSGLTFQVTKPTKKPKTTAKHFFGVVDPSKESDYNFKNKINFWNSVNEDEFGDKDKKVNYKEQQGSGTQDYSTIFDYEVPPPLSPPNREIEIEKLPVTESVYEHVDTNKMNKRDMNISEIETPPPIDKENKVYGQWTSSKFAGSVLNYLKQIKLYNKEKKAPPTLHLPKYSDSFPYATELRPTIVKPYKIPLKTKNLHLEKRKFNPQSFRQKSPLKHHHVNKRYDKQPAINVQILNEDFREEILKSHAQTKPENVEVSFRGQTKKHIDKRFYRNVDSQISDEKFTIRKFRKAKPFTSANNLNFFRSNTLLNVLPFLKSVEYFTESSNEVANTNDIYTKSLSNANTWQNIKPFNNDYTPRRIYPGVGKPDIDVSKHEPNGPSIRFKYNKESNKLERDDFDIAKGRELAMEVSNQSNPHPGPISIIKYNHGFLPGHSSKWKSKYKSAINTKEKDHIVNGVNDFNKHVKIGNALNEQDVIGVSNEQKQRSFVGGNDRIPDINRYRSDIDNENGHVPASLRPRVCKNPEFYKVKLFIHPDESIDVSNILSPIKKMNIGMEFVLESYRKCSLDESKLLKSSLLLIHWSKTPIRLFGGAYAQKTTDLCGFF